MEVECLALKDLSSPRKSSPREEEEEDGCQSEQKENICAGWRRSTPLKSSESAIPALLMGRRGGATPDLTHITPIKHTPLAEPWTPTANLKMLISAASPDIRSREMKKVLFRPIENEHPTSPEAVTDDADVEDSCQFEAAEEEDDAEKKPSRKQKSLGLLCQKFLALYPDYPSPHTPIWISLDEVAASLGVERRRIYDIVNVLESLAIVGRMAKNSYTWYGRLGLDSTLEQLQQRGRQQGYHLQIELAAEAKEAGGRSHNDDGDASHASGNRKDKSLRIMSQKFVMLFLVSKTQTVTLDAAAKILIEESQDSSSHSKYKTKVRRLYDIANVLTSLGLIKKVHVPDERGRKPAFRWLGPVDFNKSRTSVSGSDTAAPSPEATPEIRRTKLARHASFNITPTSAAVRRLVSSAPSSPHRDRTGFTNQPVDYSRKSTVCRLQFGSSTGIAAPQSPSRPPLLAPALAPPSPMPCLAYLPSLSQPSVVMLYSAPEGQRSPGPEPEESRKRRREETEGEETTARKKGTTGAEEHGEMRAEPQKKGMECSGLSRVAADEGERTQPSHYLYVPNNAGLNSLNLLLPTGAPPSSLPPASIPTLALPYVLVPSHYPLVAGGLQQQGPDAKLSFSLPTVVSPAHFMVGAAPYGLAAAADMGATPVPSPSTPEQSRLQRSAPGAPHSPSGPRHAVRISTPEPLTPHTPKEVPASASKAFFQTPGTLGGTVSTVLAGRKRGSAQRRLDVGHPAAS